MTLSEIERRFPTEAACKAYLTKLRWPSGTVRCPTCGATEKVYALKARPFSWLCKATTDAHKPAYRFSVLKGTMYENTNIKLKLWFQAIALVCNAKKGISARQLQRDLGLKSYESAWYMYHRIRGAMKNDEFSQLTGQVEVDETYVGGNPKNRHGGDAPSWKRRLRNEKKAPLVPGTRWSKKVPVIGAIARKGSVVAQVIDKVTAKTMHGFVQEVVSDKVSLIASDDHPGYRGLTNLGFPHESVSHSQGVYVRGAVHTQHLDSFWSLLKRGIMGNFHHVSKAYLPLYLAEFTFKHNHRKDGDMFAAVCAGC